MDKTRQRRQRTRDPNRNTKWHRLAGLSLTDTFTGFMAVTQEVELGHSAQRLDMAAVRTSPGPIPPAILAGMPVGLEVLGEHNLVSFKSSQESLVTQDVLELIGYGVAYAKQHWRKGWKAAFAPGCLRMFVVAVQRPQWLDGSTVVVGTVAPGVYDLPIVDHMIRLIVPRETERIARNALWHLLSDVPERVAFGLQHYQVRDTTLYSVLSEMCRLYGFQGAEMPYTKEDFIRETLEQIPPEQRVAGLSPEQRVAGLSPEQLASVLSPKQLLAGLSPKAKNDLLRELQKEEETPARRRSKKSPPRI